VRVGLLVVLERKIEAGGRLVELGRIVVCVLEVNTVVFLRNLNGFLHLSVALTDAAVHVVPTAVFVKGFGFIYHAKLDGNHG
jgi:hypothetical protein